MRNPVCRCFINWLYWPLQLASEERRLSVLDPFTDI